MCAPGAAQASPFGRDGAAQGFAAQGFAARHRKPFTANGASRGHYVETFAARARHVGDAAERGARRMHLKSKFTAAKDAIAAGRLFSGRARNDTLSAAVAKLASLSNRLGRVAVDDVAEATLVRKSDLAKRHLVCVFCCKLALLTDGVACFHCPNVAHAACVASEHEDWASPLDSHSTRLCCHSCRADLAERACHRLDALAKRRDAARQTVAGDMIGRAASAWVARLRYDVRKRLVVFAQAAGRKVLQRQRFCAQRWKMPRCLAVRLRECTIVYARGAKAVPEHAAVFGVLTVRDRAGRAVLFNFDLDEAPLRRIAPKPAPRHTLRAPANGDAAARAPAAASLVDVASAEGGTQLVAALPQECVLHGSPFDVTLVFTLFLRHKLGVDQRIEMTTLVGQGSLRLGPGANEFAKIDGRAGAQRWVSVPLKLARYPLRDQTRDDLRDMNASLHPAIAAAELRVQVEALNSLWNAAAWVEGPHIDALKGPAAAATSKGRSHLWWATLADGVFELYPEPGAPKARLSVLAHKATVEHVGDRHAFALILPDKRRWVFSPLDKPTVATWVFALELCRLRHAHGLKHALQLMTASNREPKSNADAKSAADTKSSASVGFQAA
ncbi:hypothetical protein M885DRAFT_509417 [Pelagophyceae sp. CCMP2097]|nr:hypothetical protein M885DRAFT_509417 [Pelagophyceae sp. CCMP2097]